MQHRNPRASLALEAIRELSKRVPPFGRSCGKPVIAGSLSETCCEANALMSFEHDPVRSIAGCRG